MGFYQPPQFGSNKPKFTGDEQGGAPPPPTTNCYALESSGNYLLESSGCYELE